MKIAIVGPAHPFKGGSAQHTTELAHRLAGAGHQVSLQSWRKMYPKLLYPGQLTIEEPEVALFPATERELAWNRPLGWYRLGRRLAREFDAVLLAVFTPIQVPSYLVIARAAQAGGCRVVALCHNVLPHEGRFFDEPLMRALLRRSDAVLVHSPEEAATAARLASTPVEVAPLPLHLPHADRPGSDASPAPRRNRLLFFGVVRPYKGLDLLLRALTMTSPEISLTVAGEIWSGREELQQLLAEGHLAERVTMTDRYVDAEEVPAHFATADALVLPYRSGTASQNALIAQQFGLPVIATRVGAVVATVEDGVNGILCEPDDPGDLARAISRLYEPGVLEKLRLGVQAPDTSAAWVHYVDTVNRACGGS